MFLLCTIYLPTVWFFLITKNNIILDFIKFITPFMFGGVGAFVGFNVLQDFAKRNNGDNN